ncbi:DEAD/DEAH box helicase [Mesosutterella sp. OilRF-GAM-744-9]|uniref:DEAD/DEAH box helicase n=1 Tax=Mesosutterella porci TaxID=2915351 RepID=A0ABS9MP03_9BURK|nr:DEAD/DEAH box helicase [Mesosutterella sp. oilRF-744-WT-GAM-9]MCG5030340.1 DEAD/DEAH box helicase [Mesosutterella sp. oilRF-744-WT-GAM-9]MCI6530328.1 DEAD/DEAH box helicase [Mesosutterella sp.]
MNQPFADLGLIEPLNRAVADMGYEQPTPIQQKAVPAVLQGRDILAAAQTGTGKTAAYSLPLIQKISADKAPVQPKQVKALILAPTRELAAQIHENIRSYCRYTRVSSALVFGGVNIKPQTAALAGGVDILIATPGRLLDHAGQGNVDLSAVRYLVLDEADRMLDMGFIHDIRRILKLVPEKRQNLLFSATFSPDIRRLADTLLSDPVSVEISPNKESALIRQQAYSIAKNRKRELLRDLIVDGGWDQVLVFTRMKHAANRLCQQLIRDGISAAAIHGNKSQNARTRALADFKAKKVRVLVATDIAARGLDIEQLPHVVNYELPDVPEDYVHRIGRTGRAGVEGHAVSFVSPEDRPQLAAIEKLLKEKIELITPEGYDGPQPEDMAEDDRKAEQSRRRQLARQSEARRARKKEPRKPQPSGSAQAVAEALPAAGEGDRGFSDRDPSAGRGRRKPARGSASSAGKKAAGPDFDPDNFGNSIHYRPRKPARRGRSASIGRYEPKDPFAPEQQALFLPQNMPGEAPYPAGGKPRGASSRPGKGRSRRSGQPRPARSTDYFEQNSRYSDSNTRSNLPPGMIARRSSRGRRH